MIVIDDVHTYFVHFPEILAVITQQSTDGYLGLAAADVDLLFPEQGHVIAVSSESGSPLRISVVVYGSIISIYVQSTAVPRACLYGSSCRSMVVGKLSHPRDR